MIRPNPILLVLALLPLSSPILIGAAQPATQPQNPTFERVLMPMPYLTSDVDVNWYQDVWVQNDSADPIEFFYSGGCQLSACPFIGPQPLPSGDSMRDFSAAYPTFLNIEAGKADTLSRSLRVENVINNPLTNDRAARGIELPLVREASFRPAVHLLNVPTDDGGLGKTLRIFALGTDDADVEVQISVVEANQLEKVVLHQPVSLGGGAKVLDFDFYPAVADLDLSALIDQVQPQALSGRVNVWVRSVDPAVKIWAYVGLLSPDTNQMTAITPGH